MPKSTSHAPGESLAVSKAGVEREPVGDHVVVFRNPKISPNYYLQFSLNGRQFKPSLKTSNLKKAMALAKTKNAELQLEVADEVPKRAPKISHQKDKYLASLRDRHRHAQTLVLYGRDLDQFISFAAERGIHRMDGITTGLLEIYQRLLAATGYRPLGSKGNRTFKLGPTKPRTTRRKLKVVRQLIRFTLKRGEMKEDPAPGYYLPAEEKGQAHCWDCQELAKLFAVIALEHRDLFDFLRLTGLRSDELCWMTREDWLGGRPTRSATCSARSSPTRRCRRSRS